MMMKALVIAESATVTHIHLLTAVLSLGGNLSTLAKTLTHSGQKFLKAPVVLETQLCVVHLVEHVWYVKTFGSSPTKCTKRQAQTRIYSDVASRREPHEQSPSKADAIVFFSPSASSFPAAEFPFKKLSLSLLHVVGIPFSTQELWRKTRVDRRNIAVANGRQSNTNFK